MNAPIQSLLSRLDVVKTQGQNKWVARCPAHDDKHPSLSIKEGNDGVVLLKCWSGCSASEIVDALGLELSDLFPKHEKFDHGKPQRIDKKPWSATDVLRALMHEIHVVAVCAGQLKNAGLMPEDAARLTLAIQRLFAGAAAVGV